MNSTWTLVYKLAEHQRNIPVYTRMLKYSLGKAQNESDSLR